MTAANVAQYQVLINWEHPETQTVDNFETSLNGWAAASGAIVELSLDRAYSGTGSMVIRKSLTNTMKFDDVTTPFDTGVFGSDTSPAIGLAATKTLSGLTVGRSYVVTCWVWATFESFPVKLTCTSALYDTIINHYDRWIQLETSFTAVASTHQIQLYMVDGPVMTTGEPYIDMVELSVAGDDITDRVLNIDEITWRYGRDQARALSAISPGDTEFHMLNLDGAYSPNNPVSILHSATATGAPVLIRALFENRFYTIFNGFVDDFVLNNMPAFFDIRVTGLDQLGRMGSMDVSTALYSSIYTSQAVHAVLDAINWPTNKRLIDIGSTVIPWWWEEGTTALEAISKIVRAEGIPAFVYIDDLGNFVFRDRQHRYISDNSINVTASFVEVEPQ